MCVIIHKPEGIALGEAYIRKAYQCNRDGFGFMYYDPKQDRIVAKKSTKWDIEKIVKMIQSQTRYEACYHFRIRTHGAKEDKQCHPFRITKRQTHGADLFFMHNGIISSCTSAASTGDNSDTQVFNKTFLHPILKEKPSLIKSVHMRSLLQQATGAGSKLCFMLGKGEVYFINKKAGTEKEGCWFSNTGPFPYEAAGGHWGRERNTANSTGGLNGVNTQKTKDGNTASTNRSAPYQGTAMGINSVYTEVDFCGAMVEVGDTVTVFNQKVAEDTDKVWNTEGEIVEINLTRTFVLFNNEKGVESRVSFSNDDGQSTFHDNFYFALPEEESYSPKDESKSITEPDDTTKTESLPFKPDDEKENTNVVNLKKKREKQNGDKKSDKKNESSCLVSESSDDSGLLCYGNRVIYAERHGALGFTDTADDLLLPYDDFTLLDVYEMDDLTRLEFFTDEWETAFQMFQDLVDYAVMKDDDLIPEDNKIAFEKHTVN